MLSKHDVDKLGDAVAFVCKGAFNEAAHKCSEEDKAIIKR